MNKEIELKTKVDRPEELKNKLIGLYGRPIEINKEDIYFLYKSIPNEKNEQAVRLRRENGKNIVTLKRKTVHNGVEVNDELEFDVDSGENFLEFLKLTGAEEWIAKKKTGLKFIDSEGGLPAVIELCEVSSLGWFIEIEAVIDSGDEKEISDARLRIKGVLKKLGISELDIEPRYYSEMILEKSS